MSKDFEITLEVAKRLIVATDLLGRVNTLLARMDNPYLLTYLLESVDSLSSNEIEQIYTTHDEASEKFVYKENNSMVPYVRYRETLKQAHIKMINSGMIRYQDIQWMNKNLMANKAGFRKTPVNLKDGDGNISYTPPPANEVQNLISELTTQINEEPTNNKIIEVLLIHHKFESIHPFVDGNGRVGRILVALLFTKFDILSTPATVFSYSVLKNRDKYYKGLQAADKGDLDTYLINMLDILNESTEITIKFIKELRSKISDVVKQYEDNERIKSIIKYCFTGLKINMKYIVRKTRLNNKTVKKYIDQLVNDNVLEIQISGKNKPFKNLIIEAMFNKHFS